MKKRNITTILCVVIMVVTACLSGCGAGQGSAEKDNNESGPGDHVAYGISYSVPETDWIYMFNADQLGSGDEWIDLEISGHEGEPTASNKSEEIKIDGRTIIFNDGSTSKTLLIPQADGNKYIEIRSDFIQNTDEASAFYRELVNGIEYTDDEGYIACKDYISVGGVRIPGEGLNPSQFFYGLMDEETTGGLVSVQIDFYDDYYQNGAEQTLAELEKTYGKSLLVDGSIETDGIEGKWYNLRDSMADSMTYLSHVIAIPMDELQTIMCISYDFDGDVEDLSQYDDRIKELDEQIHLNR